MNRVKKVHPRRPFKTTTSFYRKVKKYIIRQKITESLIINDCQHDESDNSTTTSTSAENNICANEIESAKSSQSSILSNDSKCQENDCGTINVKILNFENDLLSKHDDVDSDSSEECEKKLNFIDELKNWALKFQISHRAINDLLKLLSVDYNYLPRDGRTLLKTPDLTNIIKMDSGEYWENGLTSNLKSLFHELKKSINISLRFNIDGLPIYRSSNMEVWPILCIIDEFPEKGVLATGIYCGSKKPNIQNFLSNLVYELESLLKEGLVLNGFKVNVAIKCFMCDTVARSYIKGTVNFNAYHGCTKCTTVGEYDSKGRHMSFPQIHCSPRTDTSFRTRQDPDHHKENSPLEKLPIDMVKDFPVADSLHLIDLGLMKKCLIGWVHGSFNFKTKFSAMDIKKISDLLVYYNNNSKPTEIHRAIRSLDSLRFWKGLEFRTFLLYLSPVILKDFLTSEIYDHFLLLFCATTICTCREYLKYLHVADEMLKCYIEQFIDIYGIDSISSNVHNLSHIVEDIERFGPLPDFSAYPFENYLSKIKRLLRTGNKPLAQIARRLTELSKINTTGTLEKIKYPFVSNQKNKEEHELKECEKVFFKVYVRDGLLLTNENKNKWFLTKNNEIVGMINATYFNNEICIYGSGMKIKYDFFEQPIKSSHLNIYATTQLTYTPRLYKLNEIKYKLISLDYHEENIFIPLLHTVEV